MLADGDEPGALLVVSRAAAADFAADPVRRRPMPRDLIPTREGYEDFLRDLKRRIQETQLRAALAVNRELVLLYWRIGREIL